MAAVHLAAGLLLTAAIIGACAGFVFVLDAIDTALTRLVRASWQRARAHWRTADAVGQDGAERIHIDQADVDRTIGEMEQQFADEPTDDEGASA